MAHQILEEIEMPPGTPTENLVALTRTMLRALVSMLSGKMQHDVVFPLTVTVTDGAGYLMEISLADLDAQPMVVREANPQNMSQQARFLFPFDLALCDAEGHKTAVSVASDLVARTVLISHYDSTQVH